MYPIVEELINLYSEQGKKREQFHKFVNRVGSEMSEWQYPDRISP
ncbi:hypothetical protein HMPREF9372_3783 [Sporosarcina newyorkensis 2681]|uniref:Uncharacterized protein n=1 Tax=Sporosarcina newyorkensis 2681 TaxID=1027292 RepID=F9DYA2_9BACL|nr:hypothetical protein HMPREF9372_3783 [Sporosarcina newyorkensis 2681]